MRRLLLSACLLLAFAAPAAAQDAGGGLGGESALVEELTVVGRPPGPPLWRVRRGGAELIVVGAVSPIHHQQPWNRRRVDRALTGATLLLTPPEAQVGPLQLGAFLLKDARRVRLGSGPRLEARLPPDLRARFVAARERAGVKASRYEDWKPAVAGFLLLSDARQAAGLSEAKPGTTIRRMAKAKKVRARPMSQFRLRPLLSAAGGLSDADHLACLRDVLDQLDAELTDPLRLGDDWAAGELGRVRARLRRSALERCLARTPGGARLLEAEIAQSAETLRRALARPGKTVAVVDLAYLLPREGALDRLRADGATVDVPPE